MDVDENSAWDQVIDTIVRTTDSQKPDEKSLANYLGVYDKHRVCDFDVIICAFELIICKKVLNHLIVVIKYYFLCF